MGHDRPFDGGEDDGIDRTDQYANRHVAVQDPHLFSLQRRMKISVGRVIHAEALLEWNRVVWTIQTA